MIGPEHLPSPNPRRSNGTSRPARVAVVTGTRAEFGLLRPVMRAIDAHKDLELLVIAAGTHLIQPAETFREVKASFDIADSIPMQIAGRTGRYEDAESVARGLGRFARSFDRLRPDWIIVLGDRIEPFAAASAGALLGIAVAHIHGGDRAEGVADDSLRHAITKLSHVHLPATPASAERIIRMGEHEHRVHVIGSPSLDELGSMPMLDAESLKELGTPDTVFLMHPMGRHAEQEEAAAAEVLKGLEGRRVLALHPNFDPGRDGIMRALGHASVEGVVGRVRVVSHLPREKFVGLLRHLATMSGGGVLVGNSSAGLIEAAALKVRVVDVGSRQQGRERFANVVQATESAPSVAGAVEKACTLDLSTLAHAYGDGHAGRRLADVLASLDPHDPRLLRKINAY
ncbi:MAG: UDP-N-acetylglucosamine 2-epimerase (hydrolyzing) [Phycisphaerales bacterium]|nr:MAG: UDP-N-acetylglucosamine 2-epimerase (hydrolyzing) [Phycisphaerales bacterium]